MCSSFGTGTLYMAWGGSFLKIDTITWSDFWIFEMQVFPKLKFNTVIATLKTQVELRDCRELK